MTRFFAILSFLTRIPVPISVEFDPEFHKGIKYFTLVGLILSIFYGAIGYFLYPIFGDFVTAVLIVLGGVLLTGGLHLDGVADTFDGIFSYRDKERILEIMKDSRIGSNGVIALIFLILLKVGFMKQLLDMEQISLIAMTPIIGRQALAFATYKTKTPRENGMGNVFIGKSSLIDIIFSMIITVAGFFVWGINFFQANQILLTSLSVILLIFIYTRIYIYGVEKVIDGITGDILGSICETSEVFYLMIIIVMTFMGVI